MARAEKFVYRPGAKAQPRQTPRVPLKDAEADAPLSSQRQTSHRKKMMDKKSSKKLRVSGVAPEHAPPDAVGELSVVVEELSVQAPSAAGGSLQPDLSAEAERLRAQASALEKANDALEQQTLELRTQLAAAQEEAKGLKAECSALRTLVLAGGGAGAGDASSAEEVVQAVQREAEELKQENARLTKLLSDVNPKGGTGAVSPPALVKAGSKHRVLSDPARERELFAAAGFSTEKREYVTPDLVKLREALERGGVNVNCRDGLGNAPLAHAAWLGAEDLLAALVMHGADLDAENLDGATPLHFCVFNHQLHAAALLIAAGADPYAAAEDAGSLGKDDVRELFNAAANGGSHPALAAAEAKLARMRSQAAEGYGS